MWPATTGRDDDLRAEVVVVVGSTGSEVEVGGSGLAMAAGNCCCFAGGEGEGVGRWVVAGRHLARAPKEGEAARSA